MQYYKEVLNSLEDSFALIEMIFDDNQKAIDYIFHDVNPAFEKQTGISEAVGKSVREVIPNLEDYWFQIYGNVALTKEPVKFQNYVAHMQMWFSVYAFPLLSEKNKVVLIFNDITQQKKAEEALEISQELYKNTLDNMMEGGAIIDFNWKYIYANKTHLEHARINKENVIGENYLEMIPGVERSEFYSNFIETMEKRTIQKIESKFQFADGMEAWYKVIVHPVPEGIFILSIDITERKKTELELLKNQELLQNTMDNFPTVVVFKDLEGRFVNVNKVVVDLLGKKKEDIIGITDYDLFPKDFADKLRSYDLEVISSKQAMSREETTELPTGKIIHLDTSFPLTDLEGNIYGVGHISQDITELKKAKEHIEERLREKEVLLRELYHRTKNNMQVISSLLGLKMFSNEEEAIKSVFMEMQSRIRSMALVHEKLYQSQSLSRLSIKEYIIDLVNLLISSHTTPSGTIKFIHNIQDVTVLIETAIACGLIITELVLNIIKHAFPNNKNGIIKIELTESKDKVLELIISDNGIGMDENDFSRSDKLGLQIFKSISEDQLNAEVFLNSSAGTSWTIRFKDVNYEVRV